MPPDLAKEKMSGYSSDNNDNTYAVYNMGISVTPSSLSVV